MSMANMLLEIIALDVALLSLGKQTAFYKGARDIS
jgi:hypothetical protein